MIDEQQFQTVCAEAIENLFRVLARAGEQHEFEVDMNSGALTVEFEDPPAKFVVSPNSPVRQIWVSAQGRSYKLDWDAGRGSFVLPDGATLAEVMGRVIGAQLGEEIAI